MSISQDYFYFPGSAAIDELLRAYINKDAHYWWLLCTESDSQYYVCSFGSLLPYLTGRTDHIVHNIGDCIICSGMDSLFWKDTDALVTEAIADPTMLRRQLSELPMADLPVVDLQSEDDPFPWWRYRVALVRLNGVISGVHIEQMRGAPGRIPSF